MLKWTLGVRLDLRLFCVVWVFCAPLEMGGNCLRFCRLLGYLEGLRSKSNDERCGLGLWSRCRGKGKG